LPPATKVDADELVDHLNSRGIKRFFGVPDSVLKLFCEAVERLSSSNEMTHVISCNEGTALTTAAGWQMATNDGYPSCLPAKLRIWKHDQPVDFHVPY